ncbi:MAG: acyltransferase family protein [Acidimicrobiales bacterium]|nr:acyltransferase family protein [Acidimicrobiales bacterium]
MANRRPFAKKTTSSPVSRPSTGDSYVPYNPGIDGLRAIAVMAVIAYHSGMAKFSGGFLGVEIFFVISGYLITALLLGEHETNNRIDIKRFWYRRARRLFPALIAYIGGATALAYLTARDVVPTKSEILTALGYIYNWFSIFQDVSYTEGFERKNFFHHLWSLAVEEQFYLIWPLLLWAMLSLAGKRFAFALVIGGIVTSSIIRWVLYEPFTDPLRVYYGTDTRASALLIGAAVAFLWRPWQSEKSHIAEPNTFSKIAVLIIGAGSVSGLIWANMHYTLYYPNIDSLFRGGMLLTSALTALVIAVSVTPQSLLGKILGIQPMGWIGKRSYGLYLWHWPVFQLTRPRIDVEIDGWELFLVRIIITLIIVELSYQFIERPIREKRFQKSIRLSLSRTKIKQTFAKLACATIALVGCFVTLEEVQADWSTTDTATEEASQDETAEGQDEPIPTPSPTPTPAPTPTPTPTPTPVEEQLSEPTQPVEDPMERFDIVNFMENVNSDPVWAEILPLVLAPEFKIFYDRVTFLGDSVMMGAFTGISIKDLDVIFEERISILTENANLEAEVARQWNEAPRILSDLKDQELLGEAIVIHLGSNGSIDEDLIAETFEILTDAELVVVLNARVPKPWEGRVNSVLDNTIPLYENAVLVDWYSASNDYPRYFARDGVHLTKLGSQIYLDQIIEALGGEIPGEEEEGGDEEEPN